MKTQDKQAKEPMTRFCPGCGSIGPVEAKYRDCCPDGSDARMVPAKFAEKCRDLFQLAIKHASAEGARITPENPVECTTCGALVVGVAALYAAQTHAAPELGLHVQGPALQAGQGEAVTWRNLSDPTAEPREQNYMPDVPGNWAKVATQRAAPAPEPVYWESRWLDTANTPHTWSEWQRCEPRNPYTDTAADKVREIQGYIDAGYKYELRALYATPSQPVAAEGVREALRRLERAVDLHLGRSAWTQTQELKGFGYSEQVRKELYAAHDAARAAPSGSAESKGDGNV